MKSENNFREYEESEMTETLWNFSIITQVIGEKKKKNFLEKGGVFFFVN